MGLSGLQKTLRALLVMKQLHKMEEAPKERIAAMSQISKATFPSLLSRMAKAGLIEYGSGTIQLTDKGMKQALALPKDAMDMVTSNQDAHEAILKSLKSKKAREIFQALADGKIHNKEAVMRAVKCTNPATFNPLVSRELKKLGHVHYPSKGTIQLTATCFPFGTEQDF